MLRQGSQYALARGFVLSAVPVLAAILLLDLWLHADQPLGDQISWLEPEDWCFHLHSSLRWQSESPSSLRGLAKTADCCEPLSRLMQSAGPASYQVEHIHAAHSGSEVNDLNPYCIFLQAKDRGPRRKLSGL